MEWIEGEPLQRWYAGASLNERLVTFERICAAVQAAHQSLIVHCDLKPSNILITRHSDVKLFDFGISRYLAGQREMPVATRTSLRILTLNYASPEQSRDLPAGIGSDVYSLGLILYELVTGKMAQPVEGLPLDEALQTITQSDLSFDASFPADLAAIVRRACAKDVAQRYASAGELAADVARYRQGYPVLARNPSFAYYCKRFVLRNRAAVGIAAIAALLLLAALGAFVRQYWLSEAQRLLAERRFLIASELAQLMVFDAPGKLSSIPGTIEARRWMAERATLYLERLAVDVRTDAKLALMVGKSYRQVAYQQFNFNEPNLNNPQAALRNLEQAAKVLEDVAQPDNNILAERVWNHISRPYNVLRQREQSLRSEDQADALVTRLVAARAPGAVDLQSRVRFIRASSGYRPPAEQLRIWQDLATHYAGQLQPGASNLEARRNLSLVYKNMAAIEMEQHRLPAAITQARKAVDLDEARLRDDPANTQCQMDLAFSLGTLGAAQAEAGQLSEAVALLRRSVDLRRAMVTRDRTDRRAKERLAWMLGELGRWLNRMGNHQEGVQNLSEAVRLRLEINAIGIGKNSLPGLYAMLATEAARRSPSQACHYWLKAKAVLPAASSMLDSEADSFQEIEPRAAACKL